MTLTEQILFLIDLSPVAERRRNLDFFPNLDELINLSFQAITHSQNQGSPSQEVAPTEQTPFTFAARLSRNNYEDQARAEALVSAIKKIRASHAAKKQDSRVIRGS